jgi:hypothetical protein
MGMFDQLYYKDVEYQTKDTPNQALSNYKIEVDQDSGHEFLWLEHYDVEWVKDEGHIFGMYENQSNHHWVRCDDFDGNIVFYRNVDKTYKKWNQYSALFMNGRMIKLTKWEGEDYE